jgi:hypothetical protein
MPAKAETRASILVAVLAISTVVIGSGPTLAQQSQAPASNAPISLDQGWTSAEKQWWYTTSQGSRLLPLSWLIALEQADSTDKFLSDANVRRLGYLPLSNSMNGLPLGFAVDQGPSPDNSQQPWAGMTCAACHTGEFTYAQHRVRIEGAPTLADFQSFMEGMLASLVATRNDTEKRNRFTSAVLGAGASAEDQARLIADLDQQVGWYTRLAAKNAAPIRYGHGRLDAQGHILNKIALSVGAVEPLIHFPSDAPASYPFLWTTPQHKPFVQWNGVASQELGDGEFNGKTFNVGAMLRNITELIGVFGSVDVHHEPDKAGYASSLRIENMIDLENLVKRLKAPRWPQDVLPPIDANLANEGRTAYAKFKCNDCHQVLDPATELQADFTIEMKGLNEIGTDIWLACNAYLHESKAGLLEGRDTVTAANAKVVRTFQLLVDASFNVFLRATTPSASGPETRAASEPVMRANRETRTRPSTKSGAERVVDNQVIDDQLKEQRAQRCRNESNLPQPDLGPKLAYKPRPLNGIWATAPYLHNGSVASLYQLLLPPGERKSAFWVGGQEFDPKDVGFKSGPGQGPFEFRVRDAAGKIILGNDNSGHDYGTASMTEQERRALVEYLKTL